MKYENLLKNGAQQNFLKNSALIKKSQTYRNHQHFLKTPTTFSFVTQKSSAKPYTIQCSNISSCHISVSTNNRSFYNHKHHHHYHHHHNQNQLQNQNQNTLPDFPDFFSRKSITSSSLRKTSNVLLPTTLKGEDVNVQRRARSYAGVEVC